MAFHFARSAAAHASAHSAHMMHRAHRARGCAWAGCTAMHHLMHVLHAFHVLCHGHSRTCGGTGAHTHATHMTHPSHWMFFPASSSTARLRHLCAATAGGAAGCSAS